MIVKLFTQPISWLVESIICNIRVCLFVPPPLHPASCQKKNQPLKYIIFNIFYQLAAVSFDGILLLLNLNTRLLISLCVLTQIIICIDI